MIVENWGRIDYRSAWERQKLLNGRINEDNSTEERIVLCEHNPVYTVGFHGDVGNMLADERTLNRLEAEVIRIERGGDITYHGPGQLVVYPIIDLRRHGLGVRKYVELLESSVREMLGEFDITATSNENQIGVWIDWERPEARKICAIGVKIRHGITMHGLALNVNTDMEYFKYINPCGIRDKGVTSMALELGHEVEMEQAAAILSSRLLARLRTDVPETV